MNQLDLQKFITGIEDKKAADEALPTREETHLEGQIKDVTKTIDKSSAALRELLKKPKVEVTNLKDITSPDVVKALKALEKALKPITNDNTDIVAAIKALELAPTYKPEIKVSPTPITVEAPQVKVDAPDLSPLKRAIEANKPEKVDNSELTKLLSKNLAATTAVSETIKQLKFPVANVPTDPLIYYLPADIDDSGTVLYFGYTDNKGAWYIRKYDTSTTPFTFRFAFGQTNYATNFTNRASLTYTTWGS